MSPTQSSKNWTYVDKLGEELPNFLIHLTTLKLTGGWITY
jgi:hypothetical protein